MGKYSIFLEMEGRKAVVIGGGGVAVRKIESLYAVGAKILVVAKRVSDATAEFCRDNGIELVEGLYSRGCLDGAVLAVAATDDHELNTQIYQDCRELKVLCNIVDVPELCDFYVPSLIERGDLKIAISTDGSCPAYARRLRKKLEETITDQHGEFLAELKKCRERIIDSAIHIDKRKVLLTKLASDESFGVYVEKGVAAWRGYADGVITAE